MTTQTIQLDQTGIASNIATNLREKYNMTWVLENTPIVYRVLCSTMATYLKTVQTKSIEKQAVVIKDNKGLFKMAAIMTYHKSEEGEEEDKGNWTLEFTFEEEDIDGIEAIHDNHSEAFFMIANNELFSTMSGRFDSVEYCNNVLCEFITVLINYLKDNALIDNTVEIELPGVFTASVCFEKGELVIGIVPGEIIRQIVKCDDIL